MAAVRCGLTAFAKSFGGNLCLHRYLRPAALTYDACRYYVASKESDRPKRPCPVFGQFLKSVRPQILAENPGLNIPEVAKLAALKYKELSDEQKQELHANYERENNVYQEYLAGLSEEEREEMKKEKAQKKKKRRLRHIHKENKEFHKPKKPMTSYFLFCRDCMKEWKKDEMKLTEYMKEMSERWKELPATEKEVYEKTYQEARAEHEKELNDWEDLMIEENKPHLVRVSRRPKKPTKKKKKRVVSKKTTEKTAQTGKAKPAVKRKSKKDTAEKIDPKEHQISDSDWDSD